MYDDIERMLQQEIRDKKRTATGIHHRASRRGYVGAVRTQVDFLKGKEKKKYMGNGEVKISNMYDDIKNIPSIKELEEMDLSTAKGIVTKAKSNFKNKELAKHWEVSLYSLYNKVFKKYGLFEGNYGGLGKSKKIEKEKPIKENTKKVTNILDPNPNLLSAAESGIKSSEVSKVESTDFFGFEVKFGGQYSGKQITDRLMNYISILAEASEYKVILKIEEISK